MMRKRVVRFVLCEAIMEKNLTINPGRLLFGLSRIGYTTTSAICDIIDNSVRAGANNVLLFLKKEREDFSDQRKNNISEYIIVDDGEGMDNDGILSALTLGAPDNYEDHSLSKFGLGLKSAAFSQGDTLEIISSPDGKLFNKYAISLPSIVERYFATKLELDELDNELISKYLNQKSGTIIRIRDIRKNNHPSVKNTINELKLKLGGIYFYFLKAGALNIQINGNISISQFDPLFVDEANLNGNLNENEWDGEKVCWIERRKTLQLGKDCNDNDISIEIEITQLPYPPIFKFKEKGGDVVVREKYNIGAKNYGFYVYRNNRLISWATSLDGIIPIDQDFYSFRGRIIIDDSADDFFNIDVKKSNITLSDEAQQVIGDFVYDAKSKSRTAWQNANSYRKNILNVEPIDIANKLMDEFVQTELLPGDELIPEEDALKRIASIKTDMASKLEEIAKLAFEDKGEIIDEKNLSEEQKNFAIKGADHNPNLKKIFRVTSVLDNLLWEPYYDTDLGICVRINKYHIFAKQIYEANSENLDLQIIFDLMLLQFSEAEMYAYKNIGKYTYDELKAILTEYRRIVSEFLATMCRKIGSSLPPNFKSEA